MGEWSTAWKPDGAVVTETAVYACGCLMVNGAIERRCWRDDCVTKGSVPK